MAPKPLHQTRGQQAENAALSYLEHQGLRLVERNYRCRRGEIDLIMQHADALVFVEVRYRRSAQFGSAQESVDRHKQSRLIACASHYLSARKPNRPLRFDVVAVAPDADGFAFTWIRDAFHA
jgi:putative endonuclease